MANQAHIERAKQIDRETFVSISTARNQRLLAIESAALNVLKVRNERDEDNASDDELFDAIAELESATRVI